MNHLGDTNKMVSDTPRTDAEYERLFEIYQNAERINGPLCCAFENDMRLCGQLERELNERKRWCKEKEQALDDLAKVFSQQQDRIKRLEEAGDEMEKYCSDYYSSNKWYKAKEDKP